jgi:hypothetical protein
LLDYSGCFLSNDVSIHPETQKSTDNLPQMCEGKLREAPTLIQALAALKDLRDILNPPRKTGAGHKDPGFDLFVRQKVKGMMSLLNFYMMWLVF